MWKTRTRRVRLAPTVWGARRGIRLALVVSLLCPGVPLRWGATPGEAAEPVQQVAANADELLVVDCLLPGQVRRLGSRMNFLTARRPMKTTARDCEIRGGEYVAYDRANYQTALKVWDPLAKGGDPAAQTYVGEIYEKGLGVPPDYAAAAQWYRRAAEQGFSRAAINLGSLYERGLGVPRDPQQALNWYRRASGLSDLNFAVATPAPVSGEVVRLRKEVEELRRQLQEKQAEFERTQRELDGLRRGLEQRRSATDVERGDLARLRRELEEARANAQTATGELRDRERAIAEREARLAAKDREMSDLRQALVRREQEAAGQRAEIERLRKREGETSASVTRPVVPDAPPVIELIDPELVATRDIGVRAVPLRAPLASVPLVGRVTTGAGLKSLTINGREAPVDSENLFKAQVPVTGEREEVRIVAIDRGGRKSTLDFLILNRALRSMAGGGGPGDPAGGPRPNRSAFGTYHALVIGNNEYRQLRPLQTAVNDAKELARILRDDYGFQVTLLLNATRYDILSALNKLREKLTEKDNLLIYYAGHGELDKINQRGHWLPIDAEPKSSANWISNVAITDIFNAMNVRQLLVVADSCYAGTLTRSSVGDLEAGMSEGERLKLIELLAQKRSRMVMTSGGVEPVIDNVGGSHSVFAQSVIDVLRTTAGVLSGQELFRLLRLRVAAAAQRVDISQVPEYAPMKFAGHESGDFVFLRLASN